MVRQRHSLRTERQRVDAHLRACAVCRDDLLQEQRVYQAMVSETSVEYMPASSLKRCKRSSTVRARKRRRSNGGVPSDTRQAAHPSMDAVAAADCSLDRRGGGGSQFTDDESMGAVPHPRAFPGLPNGHDFSITCAGMRSFVRFFPHPSRSWNCRPSSMRLS